MSVSGPSRKVWLYLLLMLLLAVTVRLINHAWPPMSLLGIVAVGSYCLWRRERALDERERQFDAQDRQAHEQGYPT